MAGSSFGTLFRFTTWGESHGAAIGCVVDGVPSRLELAPSDIQHWLDRRRPGQSKWTTQRQEPDRVEILSGVFEGMTTGTPISLLIRNEDQRSKDYGAIARSYRPGHADFTYDAKYGIRDYRGGGRSSARETAMRVAAGGIARKILGPGIEIRGCMVQMGQDRIDRQRFCADAIEANPFWCPDPEAAARWEVLLGRVRKAGSSIGAVVEVVAKGVPAGLGEPIYDKLDADLAKAMMSINAVKGVEIGAGMAVALPNIGNTGAGGGISAGFMLCETSLRSVKFSFESPVGIPIGNSGLFLTGLRGAVDIFPDYTQIKIGLNFQAAPGGDGGIFKAYGEVTIDTRGLFEFGGGGTVLGVVNADGRLWVAWNPLDTGFEINVRLGSWFRGFARAHMWQGQGWQNRYTWLPDNNAMHFAGEIGATITIEESAVMWLVPPGDIEIGIEVAFGEFCTNNSCTQYEWGIKGKIVIAGFDVGIYYGFEEGIDFILGNDDHLLIDEYGSQIVAASAMGALNIGAAPPKVNATAIIPFSVSPNAEQILVGTSWQAGSPTLSLIDPDGVEITVANVAAHNGQSDGSANITLFGLQQPKAGAWQAKLSNLSEAGVEHYRFLYFANKGAPGAPGNHGRFLTPAAADEPGTNSYNITWEVPADVTEPAKISLFYQRTVDNSTALSETGYITGNLLMGAPIVQNLPFSAGSFQWNTTGLLNGSYRIRAVVDDGVNELTDVSIPDNVCLPQPYGLPTARAFDPNRFPGTVVFTSTGTIQLSDVTPPATPTGLSATPADSALLVKWDATSDPDVSSYLVRWGLRRPDALPQGFLVQNQQLIAAPNGAQPQHYLVAVDNGVQYGVDVAALDINGNASAPAAAIFVTPDGASNPVPLQPVNLMVTSADSTSASLTWQPNGNGPAPVSYRLTYIQLTQYAPYAQVDVAGTSAILTELATGVTYDVQVTALNGEGWASTPSDKVRFVVSNGVDANGDGLPDDWATVHGVNDGNADDDGDGVNNAAEFAAGTNPNDQDSDNDDASDGEEMNAATDPLSASEYAGAYTQPRLDLAHNTLRFTVKLQPGGEAPPQSVAWQNLGGGNLQVQAASAQSWIQPAVVGNEIQVMLNNGELSQGFHSGVVQLSAAPGSDPLIGAQRCIRVNAWVLPADDDIPPVPKQDQSIDFAPLTNRMLGDAAFSLSATASSGLAVGFVSNTPDVCMVDENMVTLVGAGMCSITALQPGNELFNPAASVTRSFQVIDPVNPLPFTMHLPVIANSN